MAYDEVLWAVPTAQYACSWDTGRAAVIQQPIQTLTYYARGVVRLGGDHEISLEVTGSDADSSKQFSANQYSASATNLALGLSAQRADGGDLQSGVQRDPRAFDVPTNPNRAAQVAALNARYGLPIAGRWRCIACGPREYETNTRTFRAALGIEGPLFEDWTIAPARPTRAANPRRCSAPAIISAASSSPTIPRRRSTTSAPTTPARPPRRAPPARASSA